MEALEGFVAVGDPVLIAPEKDGEYRYEYSIEDQVEVTYFYRKNFQSGRDYMISYRNYNKEMQG